MLFVVFVIFSIWPHKGRPNIRYGFYLKLLFCSIVFFFNLKMHFGTCGSCLLVLCVLPFLYSRQDSFSFLFFKAFLMCVNLRRPGSCRIHAVGSDLAFIVILVLDSSVLYLQCLELFAMTWMGSAQVAQPLHFY